MGNLLENVKKVRDAAMNAAPDELDEGRRVKTKKRRGAKAEKVRREKRRKYSQEKSQISTKRKRERKTDEYKTRQKKIKRVGQPKEGYRRVVEDFRAWTKDVDVELEKITGMNMGELSVDDTRELMEMFMDKVSPEDAAKGMISDAGVEGSEAEFNDIMEQFGLGGVVGVGTGTVDGQDSKPKGMIDILGADGDTEEDVIDEDDDDDDDDDDDGDGEADDADNGDE